MFRSRRRKSVEASSPSPKELVFTVVGLGGGGCNAVNRLSHIDPRCRTIAVNTDKKSLTRTQAGKRLLIGTRYADGKGAEGNLRIGRDAVLNARVPLGEIAQDSDVLFIVSGLGGGTGTGGAPPLAELARKKGAHVISLVTLPYSLESRRRRVALKGLKELRKHSDLVIALDNDKLLGSVPTLKARLALSVIDQLLCEVLISIVRSMDERIMVPIGVSDLKGMGGRGALATVLWGESPDPYHAIEDALSNHLLDVDVSKIEGALLNVAGGGFLSEAVLDSMHRDFVAGIGMKSEPVLSAFVEPERRSYRAMALVAGKDLDVRH